MVKELKVYRVTYHPTPEQEEQEKIKREEKDSYYPSARYTYRVAADSFSSATIVAIGASIGKGIKEIEETNDVVKVLEVDRA